jgi:hypothetical protein
VKKQQKHERFPFYTAHTTGFFTMVTATDAEYFFPDIDNLFDDMALNDTTDNAGSSPGPYVILPHIHEIMLETLFLAMYLDMLFLKNCS